MIILNTINKSKISNVVIHTGYETDLVKRHKAIKLFGITIRKEFDTLYGQKVTKEVLKRNHLRLNRGRYETVPFVEVWMDSGYIFTLYYESSKQIEGCLNFLFKGNEANRFDVY